METEDTGQKLRCILEAIASGRSCEQILAADRSLTYHDIFHAVAEAPTSFWRGNPKRRETRKTSQPAPVDQMLARHVVD